MSERFPFHKVEYRPGDYLPWHVQFAAGEGWYKLSSTEGLALGLTPPEASNSSVLQRLDTWLNIIDPEATGTWGVLRRDLVDAVEALSGSFHVGPTVKSECDIAPVAKCSWCHGTGSSRPFHPANVVGWSPCQSCNGTGRAPERSSTDRRRGEAQS